MSWNGDFKVGDRVFGLGDENSENPGEVTEVTPPPDNTVFVRWAKGDGTPTSINVYRVTTRPNV